MVATKLVVPMPSGEYAADASARLDRSLAIFHWTISSGCHCIELGYSKTWPFCTPESELQIGSRLAP